MAGWNSAISTAELISGDRTCSVASAPVRLDECFYFNGNGLWLWVVVLFSINE